MFIERHTITLAVKDRLLLIMILLGGLLALVLIANSLFYIRPSDVQVPVRYSAYGVTNLYRDQWFYLMSFVGAGLLILLVHPLITLKLLQEKGREYAIGFAGMTILLGIIAVLLVSAVFRVVSISI